MSDLFSLSLSDDDENENVEVIRRCDICMKFLGEQEFEIRLKSAEQLFLFLAVFTLVTLSITKSRGINCSCRICGNCGSRSGTSSCKFIATFYNTQQATITGRTFSRDTVIPI